jgi:hypothetical protein
MARTLSSWEPASSATRSPGVGAWIHPAKVPRERAGAAGAAINRCVSSPNRNDAGTARSRRSRSRSRERVQQSAERQARLGLVQQEDELAKLAKEQVGSLLADREKRCPYTQLALLSF